MTFTIPPFWCGVLATILGEVVALIIAAAIRTRKTKKKYKVR